MKIPQGVLISGICKGSRSQQSGDFINNDIGVSVQVPDGYGGFVERLETIRVYGDKGNELMAKANEYKGKLVLISVLRTAEKSKAGNAYLSQSMHADSDLIVIG